MASIEARDPTRLTEETKAARENLDGVADENHERRKAARDMLDECRQMFGVTPQQLAALKAQSERERRRNPWTVAALSADVFVSRIPVRDGLPDRRPAARPAGHRPSARRTSSSRSGESDSGGDGEPGPGSRLTFNEFPLWTLTRTDAERSEAFGRLGPPAQESAWLALEREREDENDREWRALRGAT